MPQHVRAPDGKIVEFPDGMSDGQIAAAMRREYGGPDNRKRSAMVGLAKGAFKPLDNAAVALEAGLNKVGVPTDRIANALASPTAAQARDTRAKAFDDAPVRGGVISEGIGNVLGTIPVAMVTKNPWAAGGMQGALLSDKRDVGGVLGDAALGAVTNRVASSAIDKVADVIKPIVDPAVQRLKDAGVKLTPGMVRGGKSMVREDKAMSRPVIGEAIASGRDKAMSTFNLAAVNKSLNEIGEKLPANVRPGHDAVAEAHNLVSQAYDRVIPNLSVRLDPQKVLEPVAATAQNLPRAQQKQLQTILNNTLRSGELAGRDLKGAQAEIRRLAGAYSRSQAVPDQELGRALRVVDDELTDAMIAQNPKWAPELQRTNKAFHLLAIVEDAASRADDGIITTGQLKQAARRADMSRRKSASARGLGPMQEFVNDARSVLAARTPDSGTAGRMMSGNVLAKAKGAVDTLFYQADNALQDLRLAPRPKVATPAAKTVKRLKGPVASGAVSAEVQARN